MRRSGDTYRRLLRCVEHCSADENKVALLVVAGTPAAHHAHFQLHGILKPIQSFIKHRPDYSVEFNNGSRILIKSPDYVRDGRFHNTKVTMFEEDASVTSFDRNYTIACIELRHVVARNRSSEEDQSPE